MAEQTITINHLPNLARAVNNLAREDEARKAMEFYHRVRENDKNRSN